LLVARGRRISTIKHAHHGFDMDTPGKDSHTHRLAGATEVLVSSPRRWALLHELRDEAEPTLDSLLAKLGPADLVLIEGFKRAAYPKLEVHRPSLGKPLLQPEDPSILAIATDTLLSASVPVLDLNRPAMVADFIETHAAAVLPPRP